MISPVKSVMLPRVVALSSVLIFASCPAWSGNEAGKSFKLGGTVPAAASIGRARVTGDAVNMGLGGDGAGGTQIRIGELSDPGTGQVREARITITYPAYCNTACEVRVSSVNGGLRPAADTPIIAGDFLGHVNYEASLQWGSHVQLGFVTAGEPLEAPPQDVVGPMAGDLTLNIAIRPEDNPQSRLMQGIYTDQIELLFKSRY